MVAIAIDGSGNLHGVETITDSYFWLDKATGNVLNTVPLPFNADFEQGMAYDPATGLMQMLAFNGDTGQAELWTVDVSNPVAPVFNFVNVLGALFPGGANTLTWAGIDLSPSAVNRVYMPTVLNNG